MNFFAGFNGWQLDNVDADLHPDAAGERTLVKLSGVEPFR